MLQADETLFGDPEPRPLKSRQPPRHGASRTKASHRHRHTTGTSLKFREMVALLSSVLGILLMAGNFLRGLQTFVFAKNFRPNTSGTFLFTAFSTVVASQVAVKCYLSAKNEKLPSSLWEEARRGVGLGLCFVAMWTMWLLPLSYYTHTDSAYMEVNYLHVLQAFVTADYFMWCGHVTQHKMMSLFKKVDKFYQPHSNCRVAPVSLVVLALYACTAVVPCSAHSCLLFCTLYSSYSVVALDEHEAPHVWDRLASALCLCTPSDARRHAEAAQKNVNFGFCLSIWDRIFGCYNTLAELDGGGWLDSIKEDCERCEAEDCTGGADCLKPVAAVAAAEACGGSSCCAAAALARPRPLSLAAASGLVSRMASSSSSSCRALDSAEWHDEEALLYDFQEDYPADYATAARRTEKDGGTAEEEEEFVLSDSTSDYWEEYSASAGQGRSRGNHGVKGGATRGWAAEAHVWPLPLDHATGCAREDYLESHGDSKALPEWLGGAEEEGDGTVRCYSRDEYDSDFSCSQKARQQARQRRRDQGRREEPLLCHHHGEEESKSRYSSRHYMVDYRSCCSSGNSLSDGVPCPSWKAAHAPARPAASGVSSCEYLALYSSSCTDLCEQPVAASPPDCSWESDDSAAWKASYPLLNCCYPAEEYLADYERVAGKPGRDDGSRMLPGPSTPVERTTCKFQSYLAHYEAAAAITRA